MWNFSYRPLYTDDAISKNTEIGELSARARRPPIQSSISRSATSGFTTTPGAPK